MMSRKLRFYTIVGFATIFIFFLVLNQRRDNYLENRLPPILTNFMKASNYEHNETLMEIQEVLELQRRIIESEMEDYDYPNGKYGINARLEDLVMEHGGRPVKSVILTSWRSGSTFLGDVLNAHPANFYHYEPLLDFEIVQIRGPPLSDIALSNMESLMKCDYSNLDHYLEYGKNQHPWVFNHNTHLWHQCQAHKSICWNADFVSQFCRLFPFQSMKSVRLRLRLAEKFLAQKQLGVRIILLVRDPRGTLQSRKHRDWCPGKADCSNPSLLCSDMISDYHAAERFTRKYPKTFKVVRYEDLSLNPYENVKQLFSFYGLNFHENVELFLNTHTKTDVGGVSSTFRNSKSAPFHWRNDLDFEEVEEIQVVCEEAMQLWGYIAAANATHQKVFNPITHFSLGDL